MDERMPGVGVKGVGGKCGGGRWNPTAEQVKVLTDLFRSGLRTPTTDQIQNISSHLSFYGQIESKNVFYWFQNHKARERQKRRRISHSVHHVERDHHHHHHHLALVKHGGEADLQVLEQERAIETLQLFPLNTYEEESQVDKFRYRTSERKEITFLPATGEDHPPLDLRLSSL
ncbi:hypothetical protein AAC387_Pa05g3894 [Persea americana]